VLAVIVWGPTVYFNLSTRHARYDLTRVPVSGVPERRVAIVFGAGLLPDGTPTPYLQRRVETAVKLYKAGRVHKLLMTGDNGTRFHNEPVAMRQLAEQLGVKPNDITLDYAGFNTYDSCYRAHAIFGVNQAVLVSQGYHLPRAVVTCDHLGVQSLGVDALHNGRDWVVTYVMSEWASTDKAVFQLVFKPTPTALGPPIRIN
jgi:vancomycin permeability regulator SanA